LSRDQTVAWDTHGEGTCDAAEDHPPFLVPGSSDLKPVVGDMDWACMTVLCQLFRTYILGTDGDHFFVMDQHVAHERILFEQALARFEKGDTVVQPLLIPREMNLPQQTTERVLQHRGLLQEHGFDISSGMDGITIRSVPVISDRVDPVSLLEDLIGDLDERGTATQLDRLHRRLSATIACRSAYMSGDEIDGAEMTRLVRDLAMTDNPMTCPHGRPSVLVISRQELDRRFLRI